MLHGYEVMVGSMGGMGCDGSRLKNRDVGSARGEGERRGGE